MLITLAVLSAGLLIGAVASALALSGRRIDIENLTEDDIKQMIAEWKEEHGKGWIDVAMADLGLDGYPSWISQGASLELLSLLTRRAIQQETFGDYVVFDPIMFISKAYGNYGSRRSIEDRTDIIVGEYLSKTREQRIAEIKRRVLRQDTNELTRRQIDYDPVTFTSQIEEWKVIYGDQWVDEVIRKYGLDGIAANELYNTFLPYLQTRK